MAEQVVEKVAHPWFNKPSPGLNKRGRAGFGRAMAQIVILSILALSGIGTGQAHALALAQNRISTPIRSAETQVIQGTVHPMVAEASDQGQLSGSTMIQGMSLAFRLSATQQASLKTLLQQQQTKGSPLYHRWLGPGEFAARYGVSPSDLAKIAAWLQAQGFHIDGIPASADRIDFSGTAAQAGAAFQTELHRYLLHGQIHWANATDLSVPQAIAGMTLGVQHLNTFRPAPHVIQRPVHVVPHNSSATLNPAYTVQGQNGTELNLVAPADSATIYNINGLYNSGASGTGQTIAIVGQTDITKYQADIANFRSLSGLNASNMPTQILVTTPNTGPAVVSPGDLQEADIDVEWSGAIASDAAILYITVGSNQNYSVFDSLEYAIHNPLIANKTKFVPVISISYGACEQALAGSGEIQALDQVLKQANAQGQTVVASSGDSGSAGCDPVSNSNGKPVAASQGLAVNYPASSQYVTAVGGTSFAGDIANQSRYWNQSNDANHGSSLSYIPETTWNDTVNMSQLASAGSLSASGGGASTVFPKPSWQAGPGVPNDNHRDVPDVSLASDPSHDGYVLCTEETNSAGTALTGKPSCAYPIGPNEVPYFDASLTGYLYGGTSIAAPQMAAMITLWNQQANDTTGVGNVNPILYLTAQNTPGAFHDVTSGSNAVVCKQGSPNCIADPNASNNHIMSCCNAGQGYDLATGLGSLDATAIATVWPGTTAVNAEFSLLSNSGAVSVNPGGSVTATLVLTPSNGFTGAVTLACSNLPADTSCSFAPGASVNLTSGASQNVSLTVSTTSAAQLLRPSKLRRNWPMQAAFAGVFGLSIFGIGRKRRPFPSRWVALLVLLVGGLMAATTITACSSGSPVGGAAQSQKTSTITVTGTSGSYAASAQIQLTIM